MASQLADRFLDFFPTNRQDRIVVEPVVLYPTRFFGVSLKHRRPPRPWREQHKSKRQIASINKPAGALSPLTRTGNGSSMSHWRGTRQVMKAGLFKESFDPLWTKSL